MPNQTSDILIKPDWYETIIQTMSEGVFIVDRSGVIRFANRALSLLANIPVESLIGRRCSDIMVCACESVSECEIFKRGSISSVECRMRRPDGVLLPVLKSGSVIPGENGEPVAAVETLTDISALKRSESRLAMLKDKTYDPAGFHGIIGKTHVMRQVFELLTLAGASNATVILTGETGTGKEMAARAVHLCGQRRDGPFVAINCSAIPESLLESELFGHARGAFTGAVRDKEGRFEAADGGTLFLDEVGDISPLIQVKLLRFLQEHTFERVGESRTRKTDVRVIAATNKDLRQRVTAGSFRDDLYYRLKVFPIHLPPLRERKEDIGLLVDHFIDRFNRETGKKITGLTHDAAITVMDYCWPGNIRELENAMEHAFVTCSESLIGIFDLPLEIRRVEMRLDVCPQDDNAGSSAATQPHAGPTLPRHALRRLTKERIVTALQQAGGNRGEAARMLGVERTTVWRAMRKFGVS